MSQTLEPLYGSTIAMTCSLHKDASGVSNGLPSNATAGRETTAVVNTSTRIVDYLIQLKTKLQAGTPGVTPVVSIYAYGLMDDAAMYPDAMTGTDAYVSAVDNPSQLILVGQINISTANRTYISNVFSLAAAFNDKAPSRWGLLIINNSGCQLTGTAGDHVLQYQPIQYQMV